MDRHGLRTTIGLSLALAMAGALQGCSGGPETAGPDSAPQAAEVSATPAVLPQWSAAEVLPGAKPFPKTLRDQLEVALNRRDASYEPRTHHTNSDGSPIYTNRLIHESSPYLLQHAHNPVNWRPWGEEAFAEARRLNRPVFLSVGYSTCHWCHVMERESFEDVEIASVLNSEFIPIKVDREERPDVDAVYMAVVQMLTGGGGWPMTVVLTPDGEPFFGGTYFPARRGDRGSRAGLLEILSSLSSQYENDPARVAGQAKQFTDKLREQSQPQRPQGIPDASPILRTGQGLARTYDSQWGGFGRAPKFPRSSTIEFLLRHARRTGDATSQDNALETLEQMAKGGIHDQVGGGFHRYATDRRWRVPHFEKMLYDNALLVVTYLDAYQITGQQKFADVARETLAYLQREMVSDEGGFFSATDADSPTPDGHEEEGWFFTWTPEEIEAVVGKDRAALIADRFGVTAEGNFEGRSIFYQAKPLEAVARNAGLSEVKAAEELEAARQALYDARSQRPAPLRDEKILAAWNGMAISAFARGARVLLDPSLAQTAEKTARTLLERMADGGQLVRSYVNGEARHDAVLSDYAFVVAGLLDLYEATFEPRWLLAAIELQATLDSGFWDSANGGYFMTANDAEKLLVRRKAIYDGAKPSGNSVAAANLLRLYEFTTDEKYKKRAEGLFSAFSATLQRYPAGSPRLLSAFDFYLDTAKEVILIRADDQSSLDPFLEILAKQFLPNSIVAAASQGTAASELAKIIPLVKGKTARNGKVTAYVCENRVCALPTTDPTVFAQQLTTVRPYPE